MPKQLTSGMAALVIVMNFVLPGVGTLIGGRTTEGVLQVVFFVLSAPLMLFFVGFPLAIAMWIWALVCSIQIASEARD